MLLKILGIFSKLDIDYIDMMLLHHPGEGDVEAYKVMEEYVKQGKIHSIGLSNWYIEENENIQANRNTVDLNNTSNNNEINNNLIGDNNMNNQNEEIKISLVVNNRNFSATLENNETTNELINMFPLTLNMSDLNSNEKYNYLETSLTTNSTNPRRINAGDIKLYGDNCLVVFYESFNTSYSYTNLGKIDNVNDFVSELGSGDVTITFDLVK